jgi:carbon monoxide dehydrogenase subunit G
MIEIDYTVEIAAPIDEVWTYLWNIPNWAHLMIGFQTVKVVDERHSLWTLKGDVGMLSREVDLEVIIDDWEPRSFLNFTVNGLTEQIAGNGTFRIGEAPGASASAPAGHGASASAPAGHGASASGESWRRRLRRRWAEFLFNVITKSAKKQAGQRRRDEPAAAARTTAPGASGSGARSRLTFHLEVSPGGPMAPMIELLMSPLLEPAAKDLAIGIRTELEGREQ